MLYIHISIIVSLRGYANPDMAIMDDWPSEQILTFRDLGPEVTHYYEVTNYGPFDVGNVIVSLYKRKDKSLYLM